MTRLSIVRLYFVATLTRLPPGSITSIILATANPCVGLYCLGLAEGVADGDTIGEGVGVDTIEDVDGDVDGVGLDSGSDDEVVQTVIATATAPIVINPKMALIIRGFIFSHSYRMFASYNATEFAALFLK